MGFFHLNVIKCKIVHKKYSEENIESLAGLMGN